MSNNKGIIGRKLGMTQLFGEDGRVIVVTVVQAGPCYVTQVKNEASDGYSAIQVGFEERPLTRLNKPLQGHFRKASFEHGFRILKEFRFASNENLPECGTKLTASIFSKGEYVTITGTSKGKGTQGVMKRWHFSGMPATHGNEKTPRSGGSIGNNTFPGKVFPGKKMAGRMGNETVSIKNILVVGVVEEQNLLLVKGPIPGPSNGLVILVKQ